MNRKSFSAMKPYAQAAIVVATLGAGANHVFAEDTFGRQHNDLATIAGLGGVELRNGKEGEWSWSASITGVYGEGRHSNAIGGGLHYGITDHLGVYGKVAQSLEDSSSAFFIGLEGRFPCHSCENADANAQ